MTHDPLIGQQVAHFRLERLIGSGGRGRVYAGRDLMLQRPVAIKVIETASSTAQRFIKAARLIATWRHQHIVAIHYANEQAGCVYLVMDLIDGQDLGGLLAEYRADGSLLPHDHVLMIGSALAQALDYAHSHGVVHRDVKPANILIGADDQVTLTDFGLALDQHQGSVGLLASRTHYIAPEQARSSADAVPQSDLYALGVILYELLTGTLPFDDPSPIGLALKHITEPPPSPREANPELNQATEVVILKALSKQPAERYSSGVALIQALETALRSSSAHALKKAQPPAPAVVGGADPLIGMRLDAYQVDELVGKGGMARIYRGHDVRLQRTVAIKVIDLPYQHDPDYIMRFEREAQAVAQLDHPNIVHLYYYGEANGMLYMVMQYITGTDLQSLCAQRRQAGTLLSAAETLQIVRNIGFALDEAHSNGVIHRDVHPGNILVDARGRALLTDFGLALRTTVGTRGEIFGTPHYIAPEQAQSSALVVPQSDLYALGVILYELVTGQVPFNAPNALDVALLHINQPPRPVRELNPAITPALEAVIMKVLAKKPQDRYPTGAALAMAVGHALERG